MIFPSKRQRDSEREREDLEVEGHPSVGTNAFLTGAESPEILGGFGNDVVVELDHYPPFKLLAYADVQEAPQSPHLSASLWDSQFREEGDKSVLLVGA